MPVNPKINYVPYDTGLEIANKVLKDYEEVLADPRNEPYFGYKPELIQEGKPLGLMARQLVELYNDSCKNDYSDIPYIDDNGKEYYTNPFIKPTEFDHLNYVVKDNRVFYTQGENAGKRVIDVLASETKKPQRKFLTLIEAGVNVVTSFIVGVLIQLTILPWVFDIPVHITQAMPIAAVFMALGGIRFYIVRRIFTRLT